MFTIVAATPMPAAAERPGGSVREMVKVEVVADELRRHVGRAEAAARRKHYQHPAVESAAANDERRHPRGRQRREDGDHRDRAAVDLRVRRGAPRHECDAGDDRDHADDLPRAHPLVQDPRAEAQDEQKPQCEHRLDDDERRPRVGDRLGHPAEQAEREARHPERPAQEPPEQATRRPSERGAVRALRG